MPAPADLVHQTSTTGGTGNLTVVAVNGRRSFSAAFGTGGSNVFDYFATSQVAPEWERGTGHIDAGTGALVRDTVVASTNANALVNFSAGVLDITNDVPADKRVLVDADNSFSDTQKAQARKNVYAAPFDALAYNGMQLNGSMEVSQENGVTQLTLASDTETYVIDGGLCAYKNTGAVVKAQQVACTEPGYAKALELKATTALASLANGDYAKHIFLIEGYRVSRLGWGAAGAQPLAYAFKYYAPRNATIFVKISNSDRSRCYYDEKAVVTGWNFVTGSLLGDTSGTWNTTTGTGLRIEIFGAGKAASPATAGSWGATNTTATTNSTQNSFTANNDAADVTGLIILPGIELPASSRAPFIMRPFDDELIHCQQAWEKSYDYATAPASVTDQGTEYALVSDTNAAAGIWNVSFNVRFNVQKHIAPTLIYYSPNSGATGKAYDVNNAADVTPSTNTVSQKGFSGSCTQSAGNWTSGVFRLHWVAKNRLA